MNKQGFTLIELLSVIVLIGLLFGLAIPGINKISTNMKKKSFNTKIKLVEQAGVLWGQDNKTRLKAKKECETTKDGKVSCYAIKIEELIADNYLDGDNNSSDFKNPKDNSNMKNDCVYVYKKNNRVYSEYVGIKKEDENYCKNNDIITNKIDLSSQEPIIINFTPEEIKQKKKNIDIVAPNSEDVYEYSLDNPTECGNDENNNSPDHLWCEDLIALIIKNKMDKITFFNFNYDKMSYNAKYEDGTNVIELSGNILDNSPPIMIRLNNIKSNESENKYIYYKYTDNKKVKLGCQQRAISDDKSSVTCDIKNTYTFYSYDNTQDISKIDYTLDEKIINLEDNYNNKQTYSIESPDCFNSKILLDKSNYLKYNFSSINTALRFGDIWGNTNNPHLSINMHQNCPAILDYKINNTYHYYPSSSSYEELIPIGNHELEVTVPFCLEDFITKHDLSEKDETFEYCYMRDSFPIEIVQDANLDIANDTPVCDYVCEMYKNSLRWFKATTAEKKNALHEDNLRLASLIGAEYNENGYWTNPKTNEHIYFP